MDPVLIPIADGSEELEAVTIIDLLRRAGINVIVAGLKPGPIVASRGVVITPDTELDNVLDDNFSMIVLPGGLPGADYLNEDPRIQKILKRLSKENKYTAAICAAPKVLASAGLLSGKKATSYPGVIQNMDLPNTQLSDADVVVDGQVITSRGPGTAMDFALTLIEQLCGIDKRESVEQALVREK